MLDEVVLEVVEVDVEVVLDDVVLEVVVVGFIGKGETVGSHAVSTVTVSKRNTPKLKTFFIYVPFKNMLTVALFIGQELNLLYLFS